MNKQTKPKSLRKEVNKVKPISFYRWLEVTDYGLEPRQHGEYSNKENRILGKAKLFKITPASQSKGSKKKIKCFVENVKKN